MYVCLVDWWVSNCCQKLPPFSFFFPFFPFLFFWTVLVNPHVSREEKRIPLGIASLALAIVAPGVELFPHAGGEDVFVPLVPAAVNHFCEIGIRGGAFQGLAFAASGG